MAQSVGDGTQVAGPGAKSFSQNSGDFFCLQPCLGKAADELRGKFHAPAAKGKAEGRFPGKAPQAAVKIPKLDPKAKPAQKAELLGAI